MLNMTWRRHKSFLIGNVCKYIGGDTRCALAIKDGKIGAQCCGIPQEAHLLPGPGNLMVFLSNTVDRLSPTANLPRKRIYDMSMRNGKLIVSYKND